MLVNGPSKITNTGIEIRAWISDYIHKHLIIYPWQNLKWIMSAKEALDYKIGVTGDHIFDCVF